MPRLAVFVGLALLVGLYSTDAASIEVIAATETAVPGAEGGTWGALGASHPLLNEQGEVALDSLIWFPDTSRIGQGIWLSQPGQPLREVLFAGQPAPGRPGEIFESVSSVAVDDTGGLLLQGFTLPEGGAPAPKRGFWRITPEEPLHLVEPALAPEHRPHIAPNGDWLYDSPTTGSDRVLVRSSADGSNVNSVLRTHDPIPALPGAEYQSLVNSRRPIFNRTGDVAIPVRLIHEPGVTVWRSLALLLLDADGILHPLLRGGQPAPGFPGRTLFIFSEPKMDDAGSVYFTAGLGDESINPLTPVQYGIWVATATNGVQSLLQTGDPVAGFPADRRVGGHVALLHATASGRLVGEVKTNDLKGIPDSRRWLIHRNGDAFEALVPLGDDAPGLATPATFVAAGLSAYNDTGWALINAFVDAGDAHDSLFCIDSNCPGHYCTPTFCPGYVLYAAPPSGPMVPLLSRGQTLEVAPGDQRIIDRFGNIALNDRGDAVVVVEFAQHDFTGRPAAILRVPLPRDDLRIAVQPPATGGGALRGRGIISAVIFGSEDFDVAEVDLSTIRFGPGQASALSRPRASYRGVDADPHADLVVRFRVSDAELHSDASEACIEASTREGRTFSGCTELQQAPRLRPNAPFRR